MLQICNFDKKSKALSRFKSLIFIFFLLLSGSKVLVAQKPACSFSSNVQSIFRYTDEISSNNSILNEMISVIAEDEIRSPKRISFTVNTNVDIHIDLPAGMNPLLRVYLTPRKIHGDIFYRKFIMAGVMTPDRISLNCRVSRKNSSSFFDLPEVNDFHWTKNDTCVLQCQIPRFFCDSDTVVLNPPRFHFDEEALSRFRERINLINDYYASSSILDSLDRMVNNIDLGAIKKYPRYFIIFEELNKVLEIIKERSFQQKLNLDSTDPEGFIVKYDRLTKFSESGTKTYSENLKNPGFNDISFSLDSLSSSFLDGICRYIRWSLLVTERNSTIYKEFLDKYYKLSAFNDESEVIHELVKFMYPAQNLDSSRAMISEKINKAYHTRADEMTKNQQFIEAVELLENAQLFKAINPYLKGNHDENQLITNAANGIYDSFLGVADFAIQNGKEDMAHSYMVRAQNYRKEHAKFITSDSLFLKVLKELATGSLSKCDALFNDSQYPEALECYLNFEKGLDSLTLSSVHHDLGPKIQFCRYKMLITEGEQNLSKLNKPEAGRIFFLVRQLAQKENFPPDSLLDSLCKVTYPFYLIHFLNSGEVAIWTNQLDKAKNLADSIAYLQRTTGVESSRELSDAIAQFRRKLDARSCWNIHESVDVLLVRAQDNRELKRFTTAALLTDSAVLLIRQNPDCLISSAAVNDTIIKYQQVVEFQKMQQEIDHFVLTGQYEQAIYDYPAMEQFFYSDSIKRFGIEFVPLYNYIHEKSLPELTLQAFLYYQDKNDPEEAFRYLKLLRLQDYPRKFARPYLEDMGKAFADKDFKSHPDTTPLSLVRQYVGTDKWMKRFRFAYYSKAQHLRHKPFFIYLIRKFFP
jgi:hypothetical protein